MKTLMLMLLAGSLQAALIPAGQVVTAQGLTPIHERIASRIAYAASNGYRYTEVDMDGVTFKEQSALAHELVSLGYKVELCNDRRVFGWNSVNGGLLIRWK